MFSSLSNFITTENWLIKSFLHVSNAKCNCDLLTIPDSFLSVDPYFRKIQMLLVTKCFYQHFLLLDLEFSFL